MEEIYISNQNAETTNLLSLLHTFSFYLETNQIEQNHSILSDIFSEFINSRSEPINPQLAYLIRWSGNIQDSEGNDHLVYYEISFEPQQIETLLSSEDKKLGVRKATEHLETYKKIRADDPLLEPNEVCAICFDPYQVGQFKRVLSICSHVFHKKCVDKWFVSHPNLECPMCRTNYNK